MSASAATAARTAAVLRRLLELVQDGELDAPPSMVKRLEGAVSALDAVKGKQPG